MVELKFFRLLVYLLSMAVVCVWYIINTGCIIFTHRHQIAEISDDIILHRKLRWNGFYNDPKTVKLREPSSLLVVNRINDDDSEFANNNDMNENNEYGGQTRINFVFVVGLEGTGHHFINALLGYSPNMNKMKELGICSPNNMNEGELNQLSSQLFKVDNREGSTGIFNPPESVTAEEDYFDAGTKYATIVEKLKRIQQIYNDHKHEYEEELGGMPSSHQPRMINIAINANSCNAPTMVSYPTFQGNGRSLQVPNMGIIYNACIDAKVQCSHIYLYRDPYDVLKSTTLKRPMNSNIINGIRLYTSVMQQIHSQMISYPHNNMGCFGFLDKHGSQRTDDWERFGQIFGWGEDQEAFMTIVRDINRKSSPSLMSMTEMEQLVPSRLDVLMEAFIDIHNRVVDFCYSSLEEVEQFV